MASNFCRNCGSRLTPGKSFCGNCGTMVVQAVPVAPTVSEAVVSETPASAAVPEAVVNPQPMQTVVTYHPEESVTEQLPADAVRPLPAVPEVPAQEIVPAEPVMAPAPVMPAAPVFAAPAAPAASAVPEAPKKKKHTGLIIGLICGGVAVIVIIGIFVLQFAKYIGKANDARSGVTVLDRIEVMDEVASGKGYTIYDKGFEKNVESARWWDYDGTLKSQGVYYNGTKTLAFSVKVDEKTSEKLYYAFYYSKDNDFDKDDLSSPEFSDTIAPSYYKDGTAFYNIECAKSLKPGYYCVIASKDKSFDKPYAVAYARILDELNKED